ncbi:MAG: hypothetical protein LBF49_03210 [Puniceicoccales bacterium]|jgi:hypothetical protein|nr:hypothetical protein [Puniceicoccales bacterium]
MDKGNNVDSVELPKFQPMYPNGVVITRDATPEESAEFDRMYARGLPWIDPEEIEAYGEEYNGRALAPMLEWIEGFVKNPRVVQYDEVTEKLESFSPKYNCEIGFCHDVLLPALEESGQLPKVPESLIVVLNTLHLIHPEGTRLVSVNKEGANLLFIDEFKSTVGEKIVPHAYSYRLRNYLSSKTVRLEPLAPVSSGS